MASAGRVLLISKGAWVSGTSYSPMDFVYYGGNSYVCKASVSGSTVPSSDTTHWQLMASGFDAMLITQTITNDADKIASDAAVYTECQKLESNFAVIQASNVATQAFAIGDYLTYQGELYKVTSAIANGGTITPGTNCSKTNVGTQLDALNDYLTNLIVYKAYSKTYSLTAGSGLNIYGNDLNVSNPTGYAKLGFGKIATGNDNVYARTISPQSSGASTVIRLVNCSSENVSDATVSIDILYIRSNSYGAG